MDSNLEPVFNKLENSRLQLFAKLEMKEESALNFHSGKDKWSIIQVLHHLMISEHLSIVYIKKKLTYRTNIKKTGFSAALRLFTLKLIFKSPFRYKAPKIVSKVPDNDNINQVKDQWDQTRKELKELLDSLPKEFLNKDIFKHAFAGKMNIFQALCYMDEHFRHHLKQIDRIMKSSSLTKN